MDARIIPIREAMSENKTLYILLALQCMALLCLAIAVWDLQSLVFALDSQLAHLRELGRQALKTPAPVYTATVELSPKSSGNNDKTS